MVVRGSPFASEIVSSSLTGQAFGALVAPAEAAAGSLSDEESKPETLLFMGSSAVKEGSVSVLVGELRAHES